MVGSLLVTLAAPNQPTALTLGQGTLASSYYSVSPAANQVQHFRPFSLAYVPTPARSGQVEARVNGRPYLTMPLHASQPVPSHLRAILRTQSAFMDRRSVHFAIQLRDSYGNAKVSTAGVVVTATLTRGALSESAACALAGLSNEDAFFIGLYARFKVVFASNAPHVKSHPRFGHDQHVSPPHSTHHSTHHSTRALSRLLTSIRSTCHEMRFDWPGAQAIAS